MHEKTWWQRESPKVYVESPSLWSGPAFFRSRDLVGQKQQSWQNQAFWKRQCCMSTVFNFGATLKLSCHSLSFSLALWLSAEVFRFKVVKVFLRLSHSSVILCHHVVYDISIRQGRWLRRTSLLDDTLQLCSSTT